MRLARAGEAAALVTNPIAKHVLYQAGFAHPGHTEFLAALAAEPGRTPPHPVMMLWCEALAVVPVTVHIPLARVPASSDDGAHRRDRRASSTATCAGASASRGRGSRSPGSTRMPARAARSATRTRRSIAPAVAALAPRGHRRERPLPGRHDVPRRGARTAYDVALAMYHDQALIPIKTIAFDEARERHARPALHPHLAGPRHRLRHRRQGRRPAGQPDRGAAPRRRASRRGRPTAPR